MAKNQEYSEEHEWRSVMLRLYFENEWFPWPLPTDRLVFSEANTENLPPFLKDFKTTIPRVESVQFDFSDIVIIYVGPRLDFETAKMAIQKMLMDFGIKREKLKNLVIQRSLRS